MNCQATLPGYRLVVGRKHEGRVTNTYTVGHAYYIEEHGYYLIRLPMFSHQPYFLKKSGNAQGSYTIFADYFRESDTHRFQEPVGFGRLPKDLKSHLELRLPLLGRTLFMNLFPDPNEEN